MDNRRTFYITARGLEEAIPLMKHPDQAQFTLRHKLLTFIASSSHVGVTARFYMDELGRDALENLDRVNMELQSMFDDKLITGWKSARCRRADIEN